MTIEEHQEHLLDIMDSMPDDACGDWRDSLAYAIDTIRKYQKLQSDYVNRLDKMYVDIQKLRGCSCSCSDGIIDDVEDILEALIIESGGKE